MKNTKLSCWIFVLLAVVLAAGVLLICLTQREASPRMLVQPRGAEQCAEAMLEHIILGDFEGASEYLYGRPRLSAGAENDGGVARQIWDAFTASMECTMVGECYATETGVCQDVRIRSLEIPEMASTLKERAQTLLESRVSGAESMEFIYTEDREYRPEFLEQLIRDAADEAIQAGTAGEHEITMNLIYEQGRWWVVPDEALLAAITGGILK